MQTNNTQDALLAVYDITGIQEYIFATRWMKENAGASLIVTRMLTVVLPESVHEVTNEKAVIKWKDAKDFRLEKDTELLAEIIYIGGGNAVVAYRNSAIYDAVN